MYSYKKILKKKQWPFKKIFFSIFGVFLTTLITFFITSCSNENGDENKKITNYDLNNNPKNKKEPSQILEESSNKDSNPINSEEDPAKNKSNYEEKDEINKEEDDKTKNTQPLFPVIKVVDGDTVDVEIEGKVERLRLIGVDTPEVVDPRKPVQCFGKEASNKTKEVLTNKKVGLERDISQGDRDKYGRLLRYVILEDGINFNQLLIEEGFAHEYTYSIPYKYQESFKQAEKSARENKKGLWASDACLGEIKKETSESNLPSQTQENKDALGKNSNNNLIKKSKSGICHAPNTIYYDQTKDFTTFNNLDECLKSGGRLPKN